MSLSRTQRQVFPILEVRKILVSLKSRKKFFFSFLPVKLNAFVIVKQKLIVKQKKNSTLVHHLMSQESLCKI